MIKQASVKVVKGSREKALYYHQDSLETQA